MIDQSHVPEDKPFVKADEAARAISVSKKVTLYDGRRAALSLDILIIGCGIGGLAAAHALAHAGHKVTIIESATKIGEVGAGIQVTPNLSRLLIRWGLGEQLERTAVRPEAIAFRRWKDGELVGWTKWGTDMDREHGSPYYHVHRADLHAMLFDLAFSSPSCKLRLNSTVQSVDPVTPSIKLASGETLKADLIIGADGVKSMCRSIVLGAPTKATPTGDAAYRAIIPTSEMLKDPDLRPFVENPEMTGWMGPGRHIMCYNIRAKREYNIVLAHPDDGSVESWTAEGSAEKMRADFVGWDHRIEKMLNLVPSTLKWKLMDRQPIATWIHPAGRLVLLGDSCHPMLPYRAQGAAMAVEDAAVLGNLLSRLTHLSHLNPLLRGYESLRHPRTSATQASSRLNQKIFHLPDGAEQERRDNEMRAAMLAERERVAARERRMKELGLNTGLNEGAKTKGERAEEAAELFEGNSNQWADRAKNVEQFSYDADVEAERWWHERGERLCAQALKNAEGDKVAVRL